MRLVKSIALSVIALSFLFSGCSSFSNDDSPSPSSGPAPAVINESKKMPKEQVYLLTLMKAADAIYQTTGKYPRGVEGIDIPRRDDVLGYPSFLTNADATALCIDLKIPDTLRRNGRISVYSTNIDVIEEDSCDIDRV